MQGVCRGKLQIVKQSSVRTVLAAVLRQFSERALGSWTPRNTIKEKYNSLDRKKNHLVFNKSRSKGDGEMI